MDKTRNRRPSPHAVPHKTGKPQEPARSLAAVEAILGDETDLVERYADTLFKVGAITSPNTSPYVLRNAGIMLAWTYERMVRRKVKPWKRAWNWEPQDRTRIGEEIEAKALQSPELPFIVRLKAEMLVLDAFALVDAEWWSKRRKYNIESEYDKFIVTSYQIIKDRTESVDRYLYLRACRLIETCFYSTAPLLIGSHSRFWAEII